MLFSYDPFKYDNLLYSYIFLVASFLQASLAKHCKHSSAMSATCPVYLIPVDFIIALEHFAASTSYEAPHYAFSPAIL
jgi:hypothetical protein